MTALLQEWLTRQAERRPDSVALVYNRETVTYAELEESSNKLARALKDRGCKRGDRVCFLIPKSPAAIISILGILKADCAHVPLDSSSPAPRLAKIVESCEPSFLLAGGRVAGALSELLSEGRFQNSIRVASVGDVNVEGENFKAEFSSDDLKAYSGEPLDYQNGESDAAHILFTSGSTGVPKGVVITHANVIRFVEWANPYFGMDSSDRISGHPPLHFDLSGFDIFGALEAGAQLHLVPTDLNLIATKLADFIRKSELTQWFSVPSILNYLAKFDAVQFDDFPTLKRVLWCGEVFPTPSLIHWMKRLPKVQFTNLYGPTEATIASSYYTVPECPTDPASSVPIGTPCDGEDLLVLDDSLKPVPQGEIGNLYISGVGLSPGYWRDQEKTEAAFVANPSGSSPNDRMYKTGDLARVGADGLVYFVGRADSQIKSRGYRIEMGEIESALSAIDTLEESAAVAVETEGFEGTAICCAYVPRPGSEVTPTILRKDLSKVLPNYMLPSRWLALESMPKNANGKIDRPNLREKFKASSVEPAGATRPAEAHR